MISALQNPRPNDSKNPILRGSGSKDAVSHGICIGVVREIPKDDNGNVKFIVVVDDIQNGVTSLSCKICSQSFNPRTKDGMISIPSIGSKVIYTQINGGQGVVIGTLLGTVQSSNSSINNEPSSNPGFEDFVNFDGAEGSLPSDGGFQLGDKGFINGPGSKIKIKNSGMTIIKADVNNWDYRIPGDQHKHMSYCWWRESRQPGQISLRRSHLDADSKSMSAAYRRDDIYVNPTLKNYLIREESGFLDNRILMKTNSWVIDSAKGLMGGSVTSSGRPISVSGLTAMPVKRWTSNYTFKSQGIEKLIENAREEHRYDGSWIKRYGSTDGKLFICTESQSSDGTRKLSIGAAQGGKPLFDLMIDPAGNLSVSCTSVKFITTNDFSVQAGTTVHTYGQVANRAHSGSLVEQGAPKVNAISSGVIPDNPSLPNSRPHLTIV